MTPEQIDTLHSTILDLKERLIGADGQGGVIAEIKIEILESRKAKHNQAQHISEHDAEILLLKRENEHRDERCATNEQTSCDLRDKVDGLYNTKLKMMGIIIGVGLTSGGAVAVISNLVQSFLGR